MESGPKRLCPTVSDKIHCGEAHTSPTATHKRQRAVVGGLAAAYAQRRLCPGLDLGLELAAVVAVVGPGSVANLPIRHSVTRAEDR